MGQHFFCTSSWIINRCRDILTPKEVTWKMRSRCPRYAQGMPETVEIGHQRCSTPIWDSLPTRRKLCSCEYHVNSAADAPDRIILHTSSHPIGFPCFPCQICQVGSPSSENGKAATSPTFVAFALEDRLRDALRRRRLKPDADAEPQRVRLDDG